MLINLWKVVGKINWGNLLWMKDGMARREKSFGI